MVDMSGLSMVRDLADLCFEICRWLGTNQCRSTASTWQDAPGFHANYTKIMNTGLQLYARGDDDADKDD
jgi:hypothetical protein